jgi:hypothetical protein
MESDRFGPNWAEKHGVTEFEQTLLTFENVGSPQFSTALPAADLPAPRRAGPLMIGRW